jgi:single-strand DNA-binding protein
MSYSYSHATIVGHVVRDPETKYSPQGSQIASFSLAVNRKDEASFFEIVAWEKQASLVEQYVKKGDPVLVAGRLEQEHWESKNGEKRSRIRLVCNQIQFLGTRSDSQGSPKPSAPPVKPAATALQRQDRPGGLPSKSAAPAAAARASKEPELDAEPGDEPF